MTVICTDGKTMAADGLVQQDGLIFDYNFIKLARLDNGSILGVCGSAFDLASFIRFICFGEPLDAWENSEALLLKPDGSVWCYNHKGQAIEQPKVSAIGSGASLAYGALEHGASPKEAVEIAIHRHTCCGGRVTVLSLDDA